jgi:hemolysin III
VSKLVIKAILVGMNLHKVPKHTMSVVEEVFNSITHGLGVAGGVVGSILGVLLLHSSGRTLVAFVIYSASLVLLMTASTLYHALAFTRAKYVFEIFDHSGIFLLVAGSFTPFVVRLYSGTNAVLLLSAVWTMAILGIVIKAALPRFADKIGVLPYLGMGWLGLVFVPKLHTLPTSILQLLLLGGILYSLGVTLLVSKKPFTHVGWHIFVITAAVAHYFAIYKLSNLN